MILKRIFFVTVFFFVAAFAFTQEKIKKIEHITVILDYEKGTLKIDDPKSRISIPDKENPNFIQNPSIHEISKQPMKVVDCIRLTVFHGKKNELLEIYNKINSVEDYKNLDKKNCAAAKGVNINEETGQVLALDDFIIMGDDLEWED